MKFREVLKGQVDQLQKLSEEQFYNINCLKLKVNTLIAKYESDEQYDPEEPYYPQYPGGKDPLDSPVDDEHLYDDED